jgi:polyisoprenoid-binding protein YceI
MVSPRIFGLIIFLTKINTTRQMKKVSLLIVAIGISLSGHTQNWTIDKSHSRLSFSLSHMMVSEAEGSFKDFDAKIVSAKPDFTDAVFSVTINVNSVNTDDAKRDEHLKKPDFFDVEKYPTITFKSTSIKKTGAKTYALTGNLTMHGITKPVKWNLSLGGQAVHPYTKKNIAGFKLTGKVNRLDFGVGKETGTGMLGDEVTITANGEFEKG